MAHAGSLSPANRLPSLSLYVQPQLEEHSDSKCRNSDTKAFCAAVAMILKMSVNQLSLGFLPALLERGLFSAHHFLNSGESSSHPPVEERMAPRSSPSPESGLQERRVKGSLEFLFVFFSLRKPCTPVKAFPSSFSGEPPSPLQALCGLLALEQLCGHL